MFTKKNNGGYEQNYIPKGNGEHSGEYTYASFTGIEYLNKVKEYKDRYKIDKLNFIPHISIQNSDIIDNIIMILEETNIPNIEDFLNNLYILSKFNLFGRDYMLKECKNINDLKKYIQQFYEKYPLNELNICLSIIDQPQKDYYNHYYGAKYIIDNHTIDDDLKLCNPNYDDSKDGEFERNCINCILALEMRYRNYDVEAKGWVNNPSDSSFSKLYKVFDLLVKDGSINDPYNKSIKKEIEYLTSRYDNARLIFTVRYKYNWHAIMLVINNHEAHFYDPQKGIKLPIDFYNQQTILQFEYARIDDSKINSREAKKYVKERGK